VETLLESNWESVSKLFSKMATLRVENGFKRKTLLLQSCREFHGKRYGHKIRMITSPDGQVRPDLVRSKRGRRKSKKLYKGRKPNSWETPRPTNLQPPEPRFRLPHRSHLHGEGLHEAMKEGGQGAALPHDAGGGGVPRAGAAGRAPRCSSPPYSPLSPSPTTPMM
jgi:hypothetical protein